MKIIDISLPLTNQTPVYPGNVPLTIGVHHAMPEHATHLSSITLGSHTGTHIDAPAHAVANAPQLDQIPLETFIGDCRVLDFSSSDNSAITTDMLLSKHIKHAERILLKTKNSIRGFETFYDDYVYLDGDAADYLADLKITLIGIDALSIKQRGNPDQRAHTSLLAKNIPIIEGLNLATVAEGSYQLFCLPLNFIGIEGGPARAILIQP